MNLELNENERKVVGVLDEETDTWGEKSIAFSWIENETHLNKKEISKACETLREKGLVQFFRGLMTDDGEVAGRGYCIAPAGQLFLRPCIDCKERVADMTDGRCEQCWHDRKCTKCGKPYKGHKLVKGYMQEFEFPEPVEA